ncbi:OLC1v1008071C1 [Oldenlandia corymbosa var. corymbosa]|uniref:OLC1v1008071C1 n=1 Tax=Oldenlandia corymbosa var. corymbosa TaxID=529605 RepID=A0AAV1DKQ3_OLDCO|nr:OLC1v1008071C1 [Oldenlandia corymbosa var. corymbosa]
MMASNFVEITSKEMIKPSSSTPNHLRNFKLSFLDQIAPSMFIPLITFYEAAHSPNPQLLKQSLSDVLSKFYPLSGRFCGHDDLTVDCNDSGVSCIEARVHANLSDVIKEPNMDEMKRYLPFSGIQVSSGGHNPIILALQINVFDCGGTAIALQMSHKVADGTSLMNFMQAWAATCHGNSDDAAKFSPEFGLADLFPPKKLPENGCKPFPADVITDEKIVTKRFVFDKEKVSKIKVAESYTAGKNLSRVEAISVFLWRRFFEIAKAKKPTLKTIGAGHAVNLRGRMDPPLANTTFGNIWILSAQAIQDVDKKEDEKNEVLDLGGAMNNAIRKVSVDYVKKIQSGSAEFFNSLNQIPTQTSKGDGKDTQLSLFSSWCRFPLYELDFGWGKPVWACTSTFPFDNAVILMSTGCGEGIEAWVNIVEKEESLLVVN